MLSSDVDASLHINKKLRESFSIGVGVQEGYVMSPSLFITYMDGCT